MSGLKIHDDCGNELPYYNNIITKNLLKDFVEVNPNNTEAAGLLNNMDKKEDKSFVIWIKLWRKSNSLLWIKNYKVIIS